MLFCWTVMLCATATQAEKRPWSETMVRQPNLWATRMNEAVVGGDAGGLRVEVAPDWKWAIAAVENVLLPENVGAISLRVREISPSGKWLMRLWGEVRGRGRAMTTSVAERERRVGEVVFEPDPRTLRMPSRPPVQVQLGIEGEPGDYVVFEALDFVPTEPRPKSGPIPGQIAIDAVELMPNLPQPDKMLDWRAKAQAYDRLVFDWEAKGEHLPLIGLDEGRINVDRPTFGLPSYVGDTRLLGSNQESITAMGAVVGATVARYATRYARALGKWMLNLANAARLFYPNALPKDHQCCGDWKGDPEGVIAYEGLRHHVGDKSPFATGDPVVMKWGPKTDLGLYGSGCVGLLGGIVQTTNVEAILRLDCLATDFHRAPKCFALRWNRSPGRTPCSRRLRAGSSSLRGRCGCRAKAAWSSATSPRTRCMRGRKRRGYPSSGHPRTTPTGTQWTGTGG